MIALLCFRRVNKKGVDGTQEEGLTIQEADDQGLL